MQTDGINALSNDGQTSPQQANNYNGAAFMGVSTSRPCTATQSNTNKASQDAKTSSGEGYTMGFLIPNSKQ